MRYATVVAPITLALVGGLFLASCSEDTSAPLRDPEGTMLLLSHSPDHHGVSGNAVITSTPSYAALDDADANPNGEGVELTANAGGSIPRQPDSYISSVAVFGYAWADLATGRGIVAVIHPVIGRDSNQNPDSWHTHPVQLTGGTKPSGTSDFCIVSIGASQGGIAINGDVIRVHMADHWAGISANALDVAAAFIVQQDNGCTATRLGVRVLDVETL